MSRKGQKKLHFNQFWGSTIFNAGIYSQSGTVQDCWSQVGNVYLCLCLHEWLRMTSFSKSMAIISWIFIPGYPEITWILSCSNYQKQRHCCFKYLWNEISGEIPILVVLSLKCMSVLNVWNLDSKCLKTFSFFRHTGHTLDATQDSVLQYLSKWFLDVCSFTLRRQFWNDEKFWVI